MTSKTKAILLVSGPALGHIVRILLVGQALRDRGLAVHVATRDTCSFLDVLEKNNFHLHKLSHKATETASIEFADAINTLLAAIKPKAVCYDLNPFPWLMTLPALPIPEIYITNFFLTRQENFITFQDEAFSQNKDFWNQLRDAQGMAPLTSAKNLYERGRLLYADPESLVANQMMLIADSYFIGPCFWQPPAELPRELDKVESILFLSLGSTGKIDLPLKLINEIASRLGTEQTVILHSSIDDKDRSNNILRYSSLPSGKILAKSKIAVTHGGTGTVYQALSHGVPPIIIPAHSNQGILGQIIEKKGVGIMLTDESYDEGIERLFSKWESIAQRSLAISSQLNLYTDIKSAQSTAADLICSTFS